MDFSDFNCQLIKWMMKNTFGSVYRSENWRWSLRQHLDLSSSFSDSYGMKLYNLYYWTEKLCSSWYTYIHIVSCNYIYGIHNCWLNFHVKFAQIMNLIVARICTYIPSFMWNSNIPIVKNWLNLYIPIIDFRLLSYCSKDLFSFIFWEGATSARTVC